MGDFDDVFNMTDDVVAGGDSLLGLIILGIKLTIALGIGAFVVGIFAVALAKMKTR